MERKSSRIAGVILAAIVGLLVAYPLGVGPAAQFGTCVPFDGEEDVFVTVYGPLCDLPRPIRSALDE